MKIIIVLFLSVVLFFNNLGSIALWDPDEPRQAIMAYEMANRHDYIHPYLNGVPYLEKPPMYPWLIILASKFTGGINEFSSRIPAAISALLLVLITYCIGTMLANPAAGMLSALILATNYQFLSNARESVMDMTFAFFIGLSIFLAFVSIRERRRLWFILSFIPSGFAILTKGPAGLVIPACTIFIYLAVTKELKRYILPLVAGGVVSVFLGAIWFYLAGPEYFREFILHQNVTRYMNAFDHAESLLYYFQKLVANFLPWSLLLPFAVYRAFRQRQWFPLIWFIFIFVFFEFSTSKRAIYLLSLYPACALLCGIYLEERWSWIVENRVTRGILTLFAALLTALPLASLIVLNRSHNLTVRIFSEASPIVYVFIAFLAFAGGAMLFSVIRGWRGRILASVVIYLAIAGYFYGAYYMPLMDRAFKSPRLITDAVTDLKRGRDVYTYGFNSAGIIFYVGKPVEMLRSFDTIKEKKGDILLIVEDEQSGPIKKELDASFLPVRKTHYEKEHYTIYVRRDGK